MAANYCPRCGNALTAGVAFCPACGAAQSPTSSVSTGGASCPNCGRANAEGALLCAGCEQFLMAPPGVRVAGLGRRVAAYLLDIVLFPRLLVIGWVIWALIIFGRGQTPAKQLLGIRVVRADGTWSDWGWTLLREFGIKILVGNIIAAALGGIGLIVYLANLLWAFWDKDRQTLHDKIMKTVVIDDRAYRQATTEEQRPEF